MKKISSLFFLACMAGLNAFAQIPSNGLVAAYSFNGAGNIITDNHTGAYPLSNPSSVINAVGIHGGTDSAAYFSGNNSLEVNNAAFRTGSMSVSTWFKINSFLAYNTLAVIRYNNASAPYNSWNMYTGSNVSGKLSFTLKTSGSPETSISGTTTLAMGVWYCATATYDQASGIAKLYLNGNLEATSAVLSGPIAYNVSNNAMMIGDVAGTANNGFIGSIDELLYYNRAVSPLEVNNIMFAQNQSQHIVEPVAPLRDYEEARINFNGYGRDNAFKRVNSGQALMSTAPSTAYTTDRFNNPIGALAAANNSYLTASNASAHAGMDTAITVLGWVKRTTSSTYGLFVNKRYSNTAAPFNSYALGCGSGYTGYANQLIGTISTSDTADVLIGDNAVITDGIWYFVAMTYSAGQQQLKFYVNNTLVETKTVSGTLMQNAAAPLYVGRGFPNSLHDWNGAVDDIRVFSKALTQSEIDSIRTLTPNFGAGLVSHYPLGYYPHDAVSGFDLAYNGNQTSDRFGTLGHATSFTGTSFLVPDYSPLHKSDTAITMEGWIYRTGQQLYSTVAGIRLNQSVAPFNSVLLACGSGSSGNLLGVISTVNNPDVNIQSPNPLPLNSWIHVGITYSAAQSKIKLYINGVKVNEVTATGNISYSGTNTRLSIGNASSNPLANHYFIGSIDEIKIYNRAKSEAEFGSDLCITNPVLTNAPYACAGSPLINLSGLPAGGSFSGTGVSGNTFNPAVAGIGVHTLSYYVEADGCMNTTGNTITVSGNPNMVITDNGTSLNTVFTSVVPDPNSLQWFDCNSQALISSATFPSYTPTASGSYAVLAYQNGCVDTSACVSFTYNPVSLNELNQAEVKVYPNPANSKLTLRLNGTIKSISLNNSLGQLVYSKNAVSDENSIDTSLLPDGIYFLTIDNGTQQVMRKIIIQH